MRPRGVERALADVAAIVLDVDDTIIDTRAAMVAAGAQAAGALWPERTGDHRAMSTHYVDDPSGWFLRYAAGELDVERMRRARIEDVAAAYGVLVPEDGHERYWAAYAPAFRAAVRLFDDVAGLLDAAGSAGLPVGLLSNSTDHDTAVKLQVLGLTERFGAVVTTDTLGFGKPDERVYHEVCRRLGADVALTVCIGDSLEWDVIGAAAAGMRAIWLDREGAGTTADVVGVRSLDAVSEVLASAAAA